MLTAAEAAALRLSLLVAAGATLLTFVPALLLAQWLARTQSRLRVCVEAACLVPLVLPPVVVGYGLLLLFAADGPLGLVLAFTTQGAVLASAVMSFPLLVRSMRQGFEAVEPRLQEAAQTLGAGRLRVFRTITWPAARAGVIAGLLLGFTRSLGEFGATITFAGNLPGTTRTLPLLVWTALQTPDGEAVALRLGIFCAVLAVAATLAAELLLARERRRRLAGCA